MTQEFSCQTLAELFDSSVKTHAHRPLFWIKRNGHWVDRTYAAVGEMVEQMVIRLDWMGVKHGDRVAIIANNRLEWAVCAFACYSLGAVYVPMYETQSEKDWNYIINDCRPKVLFVANEAIRDKVLSGEAGRPDLKWVVTFDEKEPYVRPASDLRPNQPLAPSYAALMEAHGFGASPASVAPLLSLIVRKAPGPEDIACLIYTSGTTGNPKGVMLSHGNIASNIGAVHHLGIVNANDRSLSFLPWAHVFGHTAELQGMLSVGGAIAICEGVERIIGNLAEVSPTVLFTVPSIFTKVYAAVQSQVASKSFLVRALFRMGLKAAERRRDGAVVGIIGAIMLWLAGLLIFSKASKRFGGRLRLAVCGGAALPREVGEFIDTLGIPVYEGYGMTETSPIVSVNSPGNRKLGTGGKVVEGVSVFIDKSASDDIHSGEICVSGPNVMQGYYNLPAETAKAIGSRDGRRELRTGDQGFIDQAGFLHINGRISEQYKLENGKFVAPAPLEDDLRRSPLMKNVLLYGLNKPYNVALIVVDPDAVKRLLHGDQPAIPGHPIDTLICDTRVHDAYRAEIERLSAGWKGYEKVKRFALIADDFTQENGQLTPTLKVKRGKVIAAHQQRIDELYP